MGTNSWRWGGEGSGRWVYGSTHTRRNIVLAMVSVAEDGSFWCGKNGITKWKEGMKSLKEAQAVTLAIIALEGLDKEEEQ